MRVCFLLHEGSMFSGGQGVYLANITRELDALGHEVHVMAGPPYPDLCGRVQLHRVPNYNYHRLLATGRRFFYGRPAVEAFHPFNAGELVTTRIGMFSVMGAFSLRAFERFRAVHAQEPFDVVHDNQVLGYGTLLIKNLGVPVVATVHHPLAADRATRIREARRLSDALRAALFYPFFMQDVVLRRLDRVVAVSRSGARAVARAFGLQEGDIDVVYNGVDGRTFRRLPDVAPEPGRLLFVGDSDDRNKGFEYLLEALRRLPAALDVRLCVVQRAWSHRAPLLAQELGLGKRVEFRAALSTDELVEEYNRAQLAVSPSLYEGFGLPAAEALACGTPVVATTAGALPEIVEDGAGGLVVPPGDAGALAAALEALLRDPDRCREMGSWGSSSVRDRFSWRRAAGQLVSIYDELLARRARIAEPVL